MNTKLFMLGLLMEKNRHPYEVQQLLKNSEMKYYIKITKRLFYIIHLSNLKRRVL